MSLPAPARAAILVAVAAALWLAAELLWTVGTDVREAALNPACRLLQDREAMGLDCDAQGRFGFLLAILAPFLGFGAVVALIVGIAVAFGWTRHLFLARPLAYHPERSAWPEAGDESHGIDVAGAAPGNADLRRHK